MIFGYKSTAAKQAQQLFQKCLEEHNGEGFILIQPHSQGGLNAKHMIAGVYDKLSQQERSMIHVASYGSASLFKFKGVKTQHFAGSDIIPWVDLVPRFVAMFSKNTNVTILKRIKKYFTFD